jgi:hypothetical protein
MARNTLRFQMTTGPHEVSEPSSRCPIIDAAVEQRINRVVSRLQEKPNLADVPFWQPDALIIELVAAASAGNWVGQMKGNYVVFNSAFAADELADALGMLEDRLTPHVKRMAEAGTLTTAAGYSMLLPADWEPPACTWDIVTPDAVLGVLDPESRDRVAERIPQLQAGTTLSDAELMMFFGDSSSADDGLSF